MRIIRRAGKSWISRCSWLDPPRCWEPGSDRREVRSCSPTSQCTPRSYGNQLCADLVEIGQGKHRLRSREVLCQTPVPGLHESPEVLDDSEGMLAASPRPRAGSVDSPPPLVQSLVRRWTPIHSVTYTAPLKRLAIGLLPVGLISEDL